MARKRALKDIGDCDRSSKVARTTQEGNKGWEWPILVQQRLEMLPYWGLRHVEGQPIPHGTAAPAASWQTRDTLSLGNWANRQGSLELSLGAGYGLEPARSPDCDGEGSDMEDTATSSCSDSSGESAQQSGGNCDSQDQQQQTQTSRQCPVGEDDSINSNQAHNSPSVAFSFGCLPCIAADVVAVWPAVEVAAQ